MDFHRNQLLKKLKNTFKNKHILYRYTKALKKRHVIRFTKSKHINVVKHSDNFGTSIVKKTDVTHVD